MAPQAVKILPQIVERHCPVCSGGRRRILFAQSFDQLSGAHLLSGYDVAVCQDCGAAFADQIPPQSVFDAYYRDLSKYENGSHAVRDTSYEAERSRQIAATILPHVPNPRARVLEIGCAAGHLLAVLQEQGLEDVRGIDPSPSCAGATRELYGIQAEAHSIFDIPQPADPFDFLILVGVMEHIRDLHAAIARIRDLLSPRGRVYIAVPDVTRFTTAKDAPFQEFSVEHVNFFSPGSLASLMQRRAFRFLTGGRLRYEVSPRTWLTALYGVFENQPSGAPEPARDVETVPAHDVETEPALIAYIRKSKEEETRVREILANLAAARNPVLVWGTGAHTLRLLATGGLDAVNISAFVDSNPKYQGRRLHGRPVLAPHELSGRPQPILISSYAAQHDIVHQIREKLRLGNELITLYEI